MLYEAIERLRWARRHFDGLTTRERDGRLGAQVFRKPCECLDGVVVESGQRVQISSGTPVKVTYNPHYFRDEVPSRWADLRRYVVPSARLAGHWAHASALLCSASIQWEIDKQLRESRYAYIVLAAGPVMVELSIDGVTLRGCRCEELAAWKAAHPEA